MTEKIESPVVGVLMGSSSDWEVMGNAVEMLKNFNVPYEAKVVSAHRMPDEMFKYAETARDRGIKVIIAGAGGAAHLPGMLAAKNDSASSRRSCPLSLFEGASTLCTLSFKCLKAFLSALLLSVKQELLTQLFSLLKFSEQPAQDWPRSLLNFAKHKTPKPVQWNFPPKEHHDS